MPVPVFCACILPPGGYKTPAEHLCFVFPTASPRGERPRKAPPFPAGVAPPGKSSHASRSHRSRSVRDFQRVGVSNTPTHPPTLGLQRQLSYGSRISRRAGAFLRIPVRPVQKPHPATPSSWMCSYIYSGHVCNSAAAFAHICQAGELCLKIKISLLPSAHP